MAAEIFLPFETPIRGGRAPDATHVRSTLIVSSMQALRGRGMFDAYAANLDASDREVLLSLIAGTWVPVALGLAHYTAANRLGLAPLAIEAIGASVGERVNKSMLSIALKASKQAGVNPWSALARAHKLREVSWRGGDVSVMKLGPKEARLDWVGIPYAAVPYYVTSLGGFLRGLIELFCAKAYTRVVPEHCSPTAVSYRISWV